MLIHSVKKQLKRMKRNSFVTESRHVGKDRPWTNLGLFMCVWGAVGRAQLSPRERSADGAARQACAPKRRCFDIAGWVSGECARRQGEGVEVRKRVSKRRCARLSLTFIWDVGQCSTEPSDQVGERWTNPKTRSREPVEEAGVLKWFIIVVGDIEWGSNNYDWVSGHSFLSPVPDPRVSHES